MIELTFNEQKLILICKQHFTKEYPFTKDWAKTLSPFCIELFGWDVNENNYNDYLYGIFNYLLKLYLKIEYNKSGDSIHYISQIFYASFSKSISINSELPIERAISELCALIQTNLVVDNNGKRYNLDICTHQ